MTLNAESGLDGEYVPSPVARVRNQVEAYEASGGVDGATLEGRPVVILTSVGAKSVKVRKNPVMRIVDGDRYLAVALWRGARKPVLVRQSGRPPGGGTSGQRHCQGPSRPQGQWRGEAAVRGDRRAVLAAFPRIPAIGRQTRHPDHGARAHGGAPMKISAQFATSLHSPRTSRLPKNSAMTGPGCSTHRTKAPTCG